MLYEIMKHLRNYFISPGGYHRVSGEIKDGMISLPFLQDGQYFLVVGSVFNDGVYCYRTDAEIEGLQDESILCDIYSLTLPKEFLTLAAEIEDYCEKNTTAAYQSESFGGYTYQRYTNGNGGAASWSDVFRGRLNAYRKM